MWCQRSLCHQDCLQRKNSQSVVPDNYPIHRHILGRSHAYCLLFFSMNYFMSSPINSATRRLPIFNSTSILNTIALRSFFDRSIRCIHCNQYYYFYFFNDEIHRSSSFLLLLLLFFFFIIIIIIIHQSSSSVDEQYLCS